MQKQSTRATSAVNLLVNVLTIAAAKHIISRDLLRVGFGLSTLLAGFVRIFSSFTGFATGAFLGTPSAKAFFARATRSCFSRQPFDEIPRSLSSVLISLALIFSTSIAASCPCPCPWQGSEPWECPCSLISSSVSPSLRRTQSEKTSTNRHKVTDFRLQHGTSVSIPRTKAV